MEQNDGMEEKMMDIEIMDEPGTAVEPCACGLIHSAAISCDGARQSMLILRAASGEPTRKQREAAARLTRYEAVAASAEAGGNFGLAYAMRYRMWHPSSRATSYTCIDLSTGCRQRRRCLVCGSSNTMSAKWPMPAHMRKWIATHEAHKETHP